MLKPFKMEADNYTLYGVLFGCMFPLGATIIESIHAQGSLTLANVMLVQRGNVLLWIIDSAPFWLGLFARIGGIRQDLLLEKKRVEVRDFASFPNENPFPIMRVSWEGSILFSNPSGLEFLGKWGRGVGDMIPEPFLAPLSELRAGSATAFVEVKHDSRVFIYNMVGIPDMQYVNIYSSDISDRKQMELDLVVAKEKAEKADRAKSEFLAKMSHELRTPMNAILGFTQILQMEMETPLTPQQRENLERIFSAGEHLLALINEVLDLSRIESGNLDLTVQSEDIVPIIENVITMSRPLGVEKGIEINHQKPPEGQCRVIVDPLRFKQVVLNIVSNAIKYNRPRGHVSVSYEIKNNKNVRLNVLDTGSGIPPEMKDRLFKPFERFDQNAKAIEGTGIGLAISKQLIELMGGGLGFESPREGGSCFFIEMTLAENPLPKDPGKDQLSVS